MLAGAEGSVAGARTAEEVDCGDVTAATWEREGAGLTEGVVKRELVRSQLSRACNSSSAVGPPSWASDVTTGVSGFVLLASSSAVDKSHI